MKKKLNHKTVIIIGVCLFIGISVVVINAHDMQTITRVKVSSQNIVINQSNTGISNTSIATGNTGSMENRNTGMGNAGELNNTAINGGNQGVGINNSGEFNNAGNLNNTGGFHNSGTNINNSGNFNNNQGGFSNSGGGFHNSNGGFNNTNSDYGNSQSGYGNQNYRSNLDKYRYQDIDWSTWKSNFVNRILDDSMYITSLDSYGVGTWFYYSFNVTDEGEIKDVFVFSLYLSDEDKKAVRDLIRSYAHKPITIFPKDSRRKKAKVKAIMLLGDTESKSDASNFNDIEKIKIKY